MNKLTKKLIALLICAIMLLTPVAVFAEDAELGSAENPYALNASAMRPLRFSVLPGETAWVVADIEQSTVTIGLASSPDYRISYNSYNYVPTSDDNTLNFGITDKSVPFQVINTGTESINFAMMVTPGTPEDLTGTRDYPETIILEENPRTGVLGAFIGRDLKNGNDGYHFIIKAPADGAISVSVSACDADWNDIGWSFNAGNRNSGIYGATHYSTEDPLVDVEHVRVSEGDEVIVMAATFDPSKPFTNPEGTIYVTFSFSALGTTDCPETIPGTSNFATTLASGNEGYYYTWTAETEGTVTITMDDETGWQYFVNIIRPDFTGVYGYTHTYDENPVIASESHEVSEGDVVIVFVATCNPDNIFLNPAGIVNWSFTFEEPASVIYGDIDGDGKILPKDVLKLRKSLGGILTLTDAEKIAADCDGNGIVTPTDVLALRKYLGGILTELPIK